MGKKINKEVIKSLFENKGGLVLVNEFSNRRMPARKSEELRIAKVLGSYSTLNVVVYDSIKCTESGSYMVCEVHF